MGLLRDGYNSLMRYFYNNFSDGFRQVRIYLVAHMVLILVVSDLFEWT